MIERERQGRRCDARAIAVFVLLTWSATPVAAQGPPEPAGRLQLGAGIGWLGGAGLGEQAADLRAGSGTFRLFETESSLRAAGAVEVRLGIGVSERFGVEARFARSRPELRTMVSGDAEASADVTLVERVDLYVIDGGLVVRLSEWSFLGVAPFVSAGGGYVRQLHEARALVEEGRLFYAGGGVLRLLLSRPRGLIRAVGVRADVRVNVFSDDLDDGARPHGSVSAGVVVTL